MRIIVLFFIFCGNLFAAPALQTSELLPASRAGYYRYQQGTDGCPKEVTWRNQPSCHGFDLIETKRGVVTRDSVHHVFCNVDRAPLTYDYKISSWEKYRIRTVVKILDQHVHKKQIKEGVINGAQFKITTEETLIFDQHSFVFDKSVGGKGWSCLYKKY